jgi:pyruvate/2-oxoglutarate dehydrogenase complex dihydrolipoamide dehydrogenase (E3) component
MSETSREDGPYDVVVIGAGAAGLVTAHGAAALGVRTAIIEKDRFGGECLWTGCVPSKALLRTTATLHDARESGTLGLDQAEISFEFENVMQSMRDVIARIEPHDDPRRLQEKGVTTIHGTAEVLGPGRVEVNGDELSAKRIVIATGSRPVIPPIEGLEHAGYLTHESIFDLDRRPDHLLVLGAGPIGIEFAQIFEGIEFHLSHKAIRAARRDGGVELTLQGHDGAETTVIGDHVLVATGMRPNTQSLGLENAGVELEPSGAVRVDSKLRTTAPGVWAAGDVTGKLLFTHVADYQARLLVRNMFFPLRGVADYSRVPWATYTDPPLARVGLTEAEARDRHGDRIGVYRYRFDDLDRAITDRAAHGLVKLITDRRGRLLGGHILGAHADTVVHEVALAMRAGVKIGGLSQMVHAYPTWPEGLRRAADSYYVEKFGEGWLPRLLRWWARR